MLHRTLYRFLGRFLKRYDRRKIASKIIWQSDFEYAINHAQLVNSRTLLFSCDIHPNEPQSSSEHLPYLDTLLTCVEAFLHKDPKGIPSIYIPSDGLAYFSRQIAPNIQSPFVLISGDSDLAINHANLGAALDDLLQSPQLLAWHAQNRDHDHPKLHSFPIGINVHNLWSNPLQWGGGFILPSMQELQVQTIAQAAPLLKERKPSIFCNWHFSIDRADRKDCYRLIDHSLCEFQSSPLPMADTWQLQSQHQFVLSPHGAGFDCHRTWEALLLGCIPIVKKARINDLFIDLPVIEVQDWSEINRSNLDTWLREVRQKPFNREKLTNQYWTAKIAASKNQ
jgi:hypothetical protein